MSEFSSTLIAHLASGADILELLESFGDERLASNQTAVYSILAMWSLSLLLFGLDVPTMTRVGMLGSSIAYNLSFTGFSRFGLLSPSQSLAIL